MKKLKAKMIHLLAKPARLCGLFSPRNWDEVSRTGWSWAWPEAGAEQPEGRGPRVLVVGGFGYRNVGDEAQLGANLERWKQRAPGCEIVVLSPHPAYTSATHGIRSEFATRVVWFDANRKPDYYQSSHRFKKDFWRVRRRMLANARCLRAGLPLMFCTPDEVRLLALIHQADVLHVSGGGFMSGMTRSRLWDHCLLIELCHLLGTPVMMTGQTIGVFQNRADRRLARRALRTVQAITLRDRGRSEADVRALGVDGPHVQSSFDDALFCSAASAEEVAEALRRSGLDPDRPFIAANFHYWGLSPERKQAVAVRFAELCDHLAEMADAPILFIPMSPSDEQPEQDVVVQMRRKAVVFGYPYDYRLARGVLGASALVFTMKHHPIIFAYGEGVPVAAVALDAYYHQKNRGAMELFGQGEYCLGVDTFYSDEAVGVLEMLWNTRQVEKRTICRAADKMKPLDGQALDQLIKEIPGK